MEVKHDMEKIYYMKLKQDFKILDYLKTFETDFTRHDKKVLAKRDPNLHFSDKGNRI